MPTSQKGSLFGALNALVADIKMEKSAAHAQHRTKSAGSPVPSDPGGYQGASTHPTAQADNHGQASSEGSRSSENESDVNADQGAVGVNQAKDATPGQQDDVQLNIGTQQSATGEDSSVEDDYKAGKDDPGSSHPARTDNDSLDGQKYANASFSELSDLHSRLSNGILADLANGQGNQLTKQALADAAGTLRPAAAGVVPAAKPRTQVAGQAPAGEKIAQQSDSIASLIEKAAAAVKAGRTPNDNPAASNSDLQAGYELAAFLGVEKRAAQAVVADVIEATIKDAHIDADLFGSHYSSILKQAAEAGAVSEGEDHSQHGDDTSGANDAEGTSGDTGGEGGGEEAGGDAGGGGGGLGDLLGGGGDAGAPPAGPPGGGGAPGGDPMGGVSEEEALMQLVSALQELGIPIDQLMQGGGGGGAPGGDPMGGPPPGGPPMGDPMGGPPPGGDPMGGPPPGGPPMGDPMGGPPPGGDPMSEGMKIASVVKRYMATGKHQFKVAYAGTRERQLRDHMKSYIGEILAR